MLDCHLHSDFSTDSQAAPETVILRAIESGLKHIALTDHMDICTPRGSAFGPGAYFAKLAPLKQKYADRISIAIGIEAGWTLQSQAEMRAIIDNHPFDYVINSVHLVNGGDCYWPPYFAGKTREAAYNAFFNTVVDSLDASFRYHTVGHINYIMRNAPYPDKIFDYADFAPVLDRLLGKLIALDKILEYNTSSPVTLPALNQIFARYYALGGRKAAFGSDAHAPARIADGYAQASKALKDIGFEYWTAVCGGKHMRFEI